MPVVLTREPPKERQLGRTVEPTAADRAMNRVNPTPRRSALVPADLAVAPVLGPVFCGRRVQRLSALLLNPFYPKDPRASYGKHVLTPTLALTSIAGATPPHWHLQYWDENLLQGPPPCEPVPQAVGITVHLTFAKRAYELAAWYRAHGSLVILGGLHVLSCPDEACLHADAIAIGDGVQLWPIILRDIEAGSLLARYEADFSRSYALDPPARRAILPRNSFLTTTSVIATRGCHNRCGFCYLSTDGLHMPYRMRAVEQVVDEIVADRQPYAVFIDNNLGSRSDYLRKLCAALRPLEIIWSAAVTIDITDDFALVRDMALSGCTGVFIGFESLNEGVAVANGSNECRKPISRCGGYPPDIGPLLPKPSPNSSCYAPRVPPLTRSPSAMPFHLPMPPGPSGRLILATNVRPREGLCITRL
jgi:hypothetical protein